MSAAELVVTAVVAGLGGSLHCVGMCGPILLGLTPVMGAAPGRRGGLLLDLAGYHLGRIGTYALLGFAAGSLGGGLVRGGALLGFGRPAGIVLALLVIGFGLVLLGGSRRGRLETWLERGGRSHPGGRGWLYGLARQPGLGARLLLGAVLGLLPCGLVYAMLALAAATASPLGGLLTMSAFGAGTVPSLTGVVLAARAISPRLRAQGTRVAAVAMILVGGWMLVRTATVAPEGGDCPACTGSSAAR